MKATKKAAILCRVSTKNQSMDRQSSELQELAKQQGYQVAKDAIYEDTISGFSKMEEREALSRLMEDIRSGKKKYDMVFVWEVSRISRSEDEGWKILLFFSEFKTPIYVKTLGVTTHMIGEYDRKGNLKRNPIFKLLFAVMQQQAESEAELTRLRSTSTMRLKIKEGHSGYGNNKAYGYTKDQNTNLVIDEAEAEVVKQIFNWSYAGMTPSVIADKLNDLKIPTKKQKTSKKGTIVTKGSGTIKHVKLVKHLRWSAAIIHNILVNPIYKGIRKFKVDEKLDEAGNRIPVYDYTTAPTIISAELFDAVQEMRSKKFNQAAREKRYLFLLKGVCTCGTCGRYMSGIFKPKTDQYYQCSSKRYSHLNCGNVSINIEALESTIWDVLKHSMPIVQHLMNNNNQKEDLSKKIEMFRSEMNLIEKDLEDIKKQMDKWKKMFVADIITEQELALEKIKVDKRIASKKEILETLKKKIKGVTTHLERMDKVTSYESIVGKIENNRYEIVEVIRNLVERVSVVSVDKHSNNTRYIIGITIKGLKRPLAVLLTNKQRNQHSTFITPSVEKITGQNRFKYLFCEGENQIEWDENGILLTPIDEAVEQLEEIASNNYKAVLRPEQVQQWNYQGQVVDMNVSVVDDAGDEVQEITLEYVPKLLPFDDSNQIEKVKQLKPVLKAKLMAGV